MSRVEGRGARGRARIMFQSERRIPRFAYVSAVLVVLGAPPYGHAVMNDTTECLIGYAGVPEANTNGGTLSCTDCDPGCDRDGQSNANGSCTFNLQACANRVAGSCTGAPLKVVRAKGHCTGATS